VASPGRGAVDVVTPVGENFGLDDIRWIARAAEGAATHIALVYSSVADDPGDTWPGRATGTELIAHVPLRNDTHAWICAKEEPMGDLLRAEINRARGLIRAGNSAVPREVTATWPTHGGIRVVVVATGNDGVPVHVDIAAEIENH